MTYVPARGDIVWMDFDPQQGHEQAGHRPGLVLSPASYNRRGLMLVCPITSKEKRYPMAIPIAAGKISGYLLADQIKSQDWRKRGASFAVAAPKEAVSNALYIISLLLTDD